MRGGLVFLVFLIAFAAATYVVLDQRDLLGPDGVTLLWRMPRPAAPLQPEAIDATPLAAQLREEQRALDAARAAFEAERARSAAEQEAIVQQRELMAQDIQAVREYQEALDRLGVDNAQAVSRMLSNMDADAAAQIVERWPEQLAVDVMRLAKQRDSGAILEAMDPDKAAVLSERIARAHLPQS